MHSLRERNIYAVIVLAFHNNLALIIETTLRIRMALFRRSVTNVPPPFSL